MCGIYVKGFISKQITRILSGVLIILLIQNLWTLGQVCMSITPAKTWIYKQICLMGNSPQGVNLSDCHASLNNGSIVRESLQSYGASFAVLLSASCVTGTCGGASHCHQATVREAARFASVKCFLINVISGGNLEMCKLAALRLRTYLLYCSPNENSPCSLTTSPA